MKSAIIVIFCLSFTFFLSCVGYNYGQFLLEEKTEQLLSQNQVLTELEKYHTVPRTLAITVPFLFWFFVFFSLYIYDVYKERQKNKKVKLI